MDRAGTSPVVGVVGLTVVGVVLGAATYTLLPDASQSVDIPDAVLDARVASGWIHVAHRGGDPVQDARVTTRVDDVPWTDPLDELMPGSVANLSRPAPDPDWQVAVTVRVGDTTIHDEVVRDGTRQRRGPDLVPSLAVHDDRLVATTVNVGPGPTPEGRQTIVYFYVDGEDPSDRFGWASNRNHTPDPLAPGDRFTRSRSFDPDALDPGPHTFEVVVNLDRDGDPNLDEVRYTNNRDRVHRG